VAQCLEGLAEVALRRSAAATAARLRGAAIARRGLAGARPSSAEQAHLAKLDSAIVATLGAADADHERHAGRTMPAHAALRLAAETATVAGASEVAADVGLTDRQLEVAALIAAGSTNRQIARTLGISEKTVEVHIHNIMERLHTPSRAGIAAWAVSHGLRPRHASER
jgi:DNA-binding NarL/FixJ family response regulator